MDQKERMNRLAIRIRWLAGGMPPEGQTPIEAMVRESWKKELSQAREELCCLLLRLIQTLALQKSSGPDLQEELFQEGMLAALAAAEKYDPRRGGFSTLAYRAASNRMGQVLERLRTRSRREVPLHPDAGQEPPRPSLPGRTGTTCSPSTCSGSSRSSAGRPKWKTGPEGPGKSCCGTG
jgi:hypothetical protein